MKRSLKLLTLVGLLTLQACQSNPVSSRRVNQFNPAPKSAQTRPETIDFLTPWQSSEKRYEQSSRMNDQRLEQAEKTLDDSLRSATAKP